jgi:hypothetical protein
MGYIRSILRREPRFPPGHPPFILKYIIKLFHLKGGWLGGPWFPYKIENIHNK